MFVAWVLAARLADRYPIIMPMAVNWQGVVTTGPQNACSCGDLAAAGIECRTLAEALTTAVFGTTSRHGAPAGTSGLA